MAALTVIFGGGGVAREVAWLLSEVESGRTPAAFIVADRDWTANDTIDSVRTMPDREFDTSLPGDIVAYLAVGLPGVRRSLHDRLLGRANIAFPALVHASARMDRRAGKTQIGDGVIIYSLASLTTGVTLGDFVQVNPGATIGHGTRIGPYTTVCPGANVSGNVTIGAACFIGAGAVIKEGVQIVDDCVIGAGAVVVCNILAPGTWAGVPARKLDR